MTSARDVPHDTCPASRHVETIADALANGAPYPMLTEEPGHCADSMRSVLESLWAARSALAASRQTEAAATRRVEWLQTLLLGARKASLEEAAKIAESCSWTAYGNDVAREIRVVARAMEPRHDD